MLKRHWLLLLVGTLLALLIAGCSGRQPAGTSQSQPTGEAPEKKEAAAPAPAPKVTRLTIGSSDASSSFYPPYVAIGRIVNEFVENVQATVVETPGGSGESTARLQKKEIDMGMGAYNENYPSLKAIGRYAGQKPWEDRRVMLALTSIVVANVVREDSGVKSLTELTGKPYYPAQPGSSTINQTMNSFEVLGIKPNYMSGSFADAAAALKDKRVIGMTQSAVGTTPSAQIQEVMAFTPLRLLGFTPEQLEKIKSKYEWEFGITLPKGSWPNQTEDVLLLGNVPDLSATKDLPQELGYRIVKAIWENRGILEESFKGFKGVTPELTIKTGLVPLHAGAVQYYQEIGLTVPPNLIPPEFKK